MYSDSEMHYRPEVDGLRAVAVISVILFHARLDALPGGFIGVDVFFVISGYLITGVICRELVEGRFSIIRFYDRRIRRIIPALTVVMIGSTILAYDLMLPDDLENFGQSLVATSSFAKPERRFISQDRRHLTRSGASYLGSIVFEHPALKEITKAAQDYSVSRGSRISIARAVDAPP
jgi:peptidoglycan/LPS O-acetylase OafA/YrhL